MKKRIVSMLLALTLVVSGMPVGMTAEGVNAAEISESEALTETEETEITVEDKDTYKEEQRPETGDLYVFNISGDGKAVGSDGVTYDDVVYLSADTVKAFELEDQNVYVEICDLIAEEKNAGDYLQNVVIAVDEEGNLLVQREASMELFQAMMEERTLNALEVEAKEDAVPADENTEELLAEKDVEDITADNSSDEDSIQNEVPGDENEGKEADTEEVLEETSKTEASVEDSFVEDEEPTTDEVMADNDTAEDVEDNTLAEASVAEKEELSTEEDMTDDVIVEETESATDELLVSAENMELIHEPEMETFEIVENAKADIILDLGYNKIGDIQQFDSILPTEDWFSGQLSSKQKAIYNASKALGRGKNQFTIAPSSIPSSEDILQAVSAYMITEPYKCDWIDLTQDVKMVDTYAVGAGSKKYEKTTITYEKSKYYTPEIQKAANAKVMELAAKAQEYALENYPAFPVFGIVEYYDKWICENNYYNMIGVTGGSSIVPAEQEAYYYCHSSYGVLLRGYGVCESYALAMTRLLDAIGIPNMYATGIGNGGGHAWNYVEMPDGKWYLQDSTWNEVDITADKVDSESTQNYLLCGDDEKQADGKGHIPLGTRYKGLTAFKFVDRSPTYYQPPKDGEIIFSKRIINLEPKQKETLTCNNAYTDDENVPKVWISSNEKVAKVDQKGNVTAVAPGIAEITYVVSGISDTCIVTVSRIDSLTFNDGGKANLTASGSIVDGKGEEHHVLLTVNQKVPIFSAEDLVIEDPAHEGENAEILNAAEIFDAVKIESSDPSVATVTHTLTGDTVDLKITPAKAGKTKIVITFGTKKATLNYTVGEALDKEWFDLTEVDKLVNDQNLMYTGKAYKPKVVLTDAGKAKKVKFKVSYLNNKDAGTASVVISGTGAYGGEIRRTFTIKPLALNVDSSSLKIAASNLYNGGTNQAKSTVKHLNGTKKVGLKAGKDYDIMYKKGENQSTAYPKEVGIYTMQIVGKGNYTGTYSVPNTTTYEIKKNDIKKVKVTVKVTGTVPTVTVAIGKNVLPRSDYKLTYYTDKKCEDQIPGSVFMKKTQYFVKVEPAETGSNIEIGAKSSPTVKSFKTK